MGNEPSTPIGRPKSINYTYLPDIVRRENERMEQAHKCHQCMKRKRKTQTPLVINGKLRAIDDSYDLSQVIEEGTGLEHDTCCDKCCELYDSHDQKQVRQ